MQDHTGALRQMEPLALRRMGDLQLLSALGRLNLTVGNVEGAREIFQRVRSALTTAGNGQSADRDALVLSNR